MMNTKSKIIQGVLLQDNDSWQVEYEAEKAGDDASWFNKLPLHPDDFTFTLSHGKKVNFLIVNEPAFKECGEGDTNYDIQYAKLVDESFLKTSQIENNISNT